MADDAPSATTAAAIDALLADLQRLDAAHEDASPVEVPGALGGFAVSAVAPGSAAELRILPVHPQADGSVPPPAPPVLLPALPTPRADPWAIDAELDALLDPARVFQGPTGPGRRALYHLPPTTLPSSRLLAQVPMGPARMELVPTPARMVLAPLELDYAFRPMTAASAASAAAATLEGFSEAMKSQREYAKQNVGKQPFAPGGGALTDRRDVAPQGDDAAAHTSAGQKEDDDDHQRLVQLVLGEQPPSTTTPDADLAALAVRAPGLDGCLTLEDVRATEAQRTAAATTTAESNENDADSASAVGANPAHLLRPYFEVVADADHVRAIQRSVADERASRAMEKPSDGGMLALDELLHDLEEDEELLKLGFHANGDDDEEKEDENDNGSGQDASTVEMPTAGAQEPSVPSGSTGPMVDTSGTDAMLAPDAEVELLLASDVDIRARTSTPVASEWASMASVDVRNFHAKVPDMAMKYDFELDTFQKECVIHLERHECVFVAAHTSAGKTVVAEYAIAMSQKHMTRTIYTSPIKALSNQKYRDFREKFGAERVGLITGDVSINPEASCLVMTTEILRSMLYRGADVIRDIEWVIFDEIHYINDSERGVVWEEVIIMLPEHVGMVFLSATTPNHLEFSDWIGRTKKKRIHVISTYKRPVPLQHFLYAGKELFKLYDAMSGYNAGAYGAAKAKLCPPSDKVAKGSATGRAGGGGSAGGGSARNLGRTSGGDQSDWTKLIYSLKEKTLLPVVVFAFSKRLCEESANKLGKLDLSTPAERSEIHLFLEASIQRLQGSDRELPQVLTMKEMLKRGIGVHHGGLLPIIKEMVEILFGRGLVKVLFSTETFAMGVNMPARTVVFNGIRKHDGKSFRDLLPGEYTQMAGRAGRRGLDSVGTVIIACWNDIPEPTSLQTMLAGKATSLSSQFRLTYNMILNLLRVEVLTVEDMMKRSFSEFHTQKALASKRVPQLIQRGRKLLVKLEQALRDEYPHLDSSGELEEIRGFYALRRQKRELEKKLVKWMLTNHAQAARAAIAPGRVVLVNVKGLPTDHYALVVRTTAKPTESEVSSGTARFSTRIGFDNTPTEEAAAKPSRGTALFKSVTVVCLCPDNYEPPKTASSDNSTSDDRRGQQALGGGRLLRNKRDEDDGLFGMMRSGSGKKKKGGASIDDVDDAAATLESGVKGNILGRNYVVLDVPESCIDVVSSQLAPVTSINVRNLVATSSRKELAATVEYLTKVEQDSAATQKLDVVFVDVLNELRINDLEVATAYSSWQQLHSILLSHRCASATPSLLRILGKVEKICKLQDYLARLKRELSNDSLSLFPDFQQRLGVLKRLGYISEDGVVQVKGRVACEVNTCEEVVLTEMIFENVLVNLEPEEIVAVLSALIFQEKTQNVPTLTPRLEAARDTVQRIAESLGVIQLEQHLEIDPAVYCKGALNFGLMEVVYQWARGMSFKELCQLTDVQEGSIVRCITRLDEVCREVRNAARVIGDPRLYRKMEVASEAIKRDVVFASSLYLA